MKKILQISDRKNGIQCEFEYLDAAVKEAMKRAIETHSEAIVMLTTFDNNGEVTGSTVVARIRGNKFDEYGRIKGESKNE